MAQRRVLIVDDEPYVTSMVALKLRQAGFEVLVASHGREAYELACREAVDLLVTDYQMPVMSGHELGILLRETPATASLPVVMLTARGHRLTPTELARTNIRWMLAKPFSAKELVRRVEEILASRAPEVPPETQSPAGGRPEAA